MTDAMIQGRYEMRIKQYASDLADLVVAGEITDTEANERMVEFQDRMARDGVWG